MPSLTNLRNIWSANPADPSQDQAFSAALSTLQKLSRSGVSVPDDVAMPIIAHAAAPQSTSGPDRRAVILAVHQLNIGVKYWNDTRRRYCRSFYVVLTVLLVLQFFSAAATDVLTNLGEAQVRLHAAATPPSVATDKASPALGDATAKRDTYLASGEYVTAIPAKIVAAIPMVRSLLPPLRPIGSDGKTSPDADARTETTLIELRLMTSFLGAYLLPLLYGMLGAVASILRKISTAAEAGDDLDHLRRRLDLRLPVGALSGLAAGWLLQPAALPGSTLSPLALAFVAGYAAELVFAAMDRIVAAFSTDSPDRVRDGGSQTVSTQDAADGVPTGRAGSEAANAEAPGTVEGPGAKAAGADGADVGVTPTSKALANDEAKGRNDD